MPHGRLANRTQHALRERVDLLGWLRLHDHQKLLATPAHDHVFVAQGGSQALCHVDQHRVAHAVPVLVVDALEVVDVDQAHRAGELAVGGELAHHGLEVTPVRQPGERVALALHLQQVIGRRQLAVRAAHPAVQQAHGRERQHEHQCQQPPQALLQVSAVELLGGDLAFAFQQHQLARAPVGVVLLLHRENGFLLVTLQDAGRQCAVVVQGGQRAGQVAGLFQVGAEFAVGIGHARQRAAPLVDGDGLLHAALAQLQVLHRNVRQADVHQRHRLAIHFLEFARQRQGLFGARQCRLVVARFQEEVGQVGEVQGLVDLRASAAGMLDRQLERTSFALQVAEAVEDDAGGVVGVCQ